MSWPLKKLGEISPAKPHKFSSLSNETEILHINLDQVESGSGRLIQRIMKPLAEAGNSTHGFNNKHVLYSKLRPYLNKVFLPDEIGLCTTELVPMLPNENLVNRIYLAHYLKSKNFVDWISNQTAGAKMPRVSMDKFWAHEIPVPPLPEQKRIAAILDKADSIRRKRQQAIKLADEFLRAVFLDMFGDPVTNPKGWKVGPLNNGITSIQSGWSANGTNEPCNEDQFGVLKISSVTSGTFKKSENKLVSFDDIPANKNLIFPKNGDLLFSRANTRELVAATCIVNEDVKNVFLPDKLWLIETDRKKLLPEFLHCMIWHPKFKESLTSQATGTSGSMLNISMSKFKSTNAVFPSIKQQGIFSDIYWKTQHAKNSFLNSNDEIELLFSSLSQKAFSGKL